MAVDRFFSPPLHYELFKRCIINEVDVVIADKRKLKEYKEDLEDRSREATAIEYKDRKAILDEVQDLLLDEFRPPKQENKLLSLLHQLGLSLDEHGLVTLETHPPRKKPLKRHLGVKEPYFSVQERRLIEEEERLRVQKRDLCILDKWLAKIGGAAVRVQKPSHPAKPNSRKLRKLKSPHLVSSKEKYLRSSDKPVKKQGKTSYIADKTKSIVPEENETQSKVSIEVKDSPDENKIFDNEGIRLRRKSIESNFIQASRSESSEELNIPDNDTVDLNIKIANHKPASESDGGVEFKQKFKIKHDKDEVANLDTKYEASIRSDRRSESKVPLKVDIQGKGNLERNRKDGDETLLELFIERENKQPSESKSNVKVNVESDLTNEKLIRRDESKEYLNLYTDVEDKLYANESKISSHFDTGIKNKIFGKTTDESPPELPTANKDKTSSKYDIEDKLNTGTAKQSALKPLIENKVPLKLTAQNTDKLNVRKTDKVFTKLHMEDEDKMIVKSDAGTKVERHLDKGQSKKYQINQKLPPKLKISTDSDATLVNSEDVIISEDKKTIPETPEEPHERGRENIIRKTLDTKLSKSGTEISCHNPNIKSGSLNKLETLDNEEMILEPNDLNQDESLFKEDKIDFKITHTDNKVLHEKISSSEKEKDSLERLYEDFNDLIKEFSSVHHEEFDDNDPLPDAETTEQIKRNESMLDPSHTRKQVIPSKGSEERDKKSSKKMKLFSRTTLKIKHKKPKQEMKRYDNSRMVNRKNVIITNLKPGVRNEEHFGPKLEKGTRKSITKIKLSRKPTKPTIEQESATYENTQPIQDQKPKKYVPNYDHNFGKDINSIRDKKAMNDAKFLCKKPGNDKMSTHDQKVRKNTIPANELKLGSSKKVQNDVTVETRKKSITKNWKNFISNKRDLRKISHDLLEGVRELKAKRELILIKSLHEKLDESKNKKK